MSALPPNLDPNTLANAGREYTVRTADNGKILFLGGASDGRVGTMFVEFVPDVSFAGSLTVLARPYGHPASDNGVGFSDQPFRKVSLANVAQDRSVTTNTLTPLTNAFRIEVPANGVVIGLLCGCTAGTGVLYSWPLNGPST